MKSFHEALARNVHECSLELDIGKVSTNLTLADPAQDVRGHHAVDKDGKDLGEVDDWIIAISTPAIRHRYPNGRACVAELLAQPGSYP
jgi:hypothetical protein